MRSAHGVVTLAQEGRFKLVTDDGRVLHLILAHDAPLEPQDLTPLQCAQARVWVEYEEVPQLTAGLVHRLSEEA